MTFNIDYESSAMLDIPYEDIIKKVALAVLDYEKCPYDTEISIVLTDNESIQAINQEFRTINLPTDVLSFPMITFDPPAEYDFLEDVDDCFNPDTGELLLGDIMVSTEKVVEQAEAYGHTLERELAFLIAHSVLHLLGYDHIDDADRILMEERQSVILQTIGITR